ncbi:ArnT family glycosyltransferase [Saccharicrinis sp. GN24d3]|uniref:ArnT family glycosyltransferase n=1 Tax=Saccharicrinis sp. GN24d3 TaxID=3458416 RepID=UPI00403553AA
MKWNNDIIIGFACLLKIGLHLLADIHSGFQGDELLHIDAGNHLAFGFMEFPPLIGVFAYLQNLTGSTSVIVHHLFSHLASMAIFILAGKITLELGGKTKALLLVMTFLLAAPAFTRTHQLFQPVVFSQFFWLLGFILFVRFVKTLNKKYLLLLALTLAAGFLNKYDILFFVAGLISLLFFKRTRNGILGRETIIYPVLFILLISPNIIWQIINDFPVLHHMKELYKAQLNDQSATKGLLNLFIQLNPFAIGIYTAGFVYAVFLKKDEHNHIVSLSILISILLLAVSKGKHYYFFPALICLVILGSVWFEIKVFNKRNWLYCAQIILLVIGGAVMLPYGMTILKLDRFIKYAHIKNEENHYPLPFEEFYSQYQWRKVLSSVKRIYDDLHLEDKKNCVIWGKHYKQAGAVNLFSEEYNVPKAISYHGSYYQWAPNDGNLPGTLIAISNKGVPKEYWEYFFSTVEVTDTILNPYADESEDELTTIYICREPKTNYAGLKDIFRNRIFE